jgi:hypothetical protein
MPDAPLVTDPVSLPIWAIAACGLLLVVLAAVAIARAGSRPTFGLLAQVAGAGLLVALGWFYFDRLESHDRAEQRRIIEARHAALTAQALAPNSILACLDPHGGSVLIEGCEKTIYSSPEQVAASLAFVAARLDLLKEIDALPGAAEREYAALRESLVKAVAADSFGLVAQVLETRDGCLPSSCYAFDLVDDRQQLAANMSGRAYEARIARYAPGWGQRPTGPALASTPGMPTSGSGNPVNINFPSASSIPPVSIMSNEPGMTGQTGVDAPAKPEARPAPAAATPPPPRRPPAQKAQAPRPAPPPAAPPTAAPAQASPFPTPVGTAQSGGAPVPIGPQ